MSFEPLKEAAMQAASSPKVTAAVSAGTATLSGLRALDIVNGYLTTIGMTAGIVVTCILGLVHFTKFLINLQELANARRRNKESGSSS